MLKSIAVQQQIQLPEERSLPVYIKYDKIKQLIHKKARNKKKPLDVAYDLFSKNANLGNYITLSEHLKDVDDYRTVSYTATNKEKGLGINPKKVVFPDSTLITQLGVINTTRRQIEQTMFNDEPDTDFFARLASKLNVPLMLIPSYLKLNSLEEDKVNYRKTGSDYIKPVVKKREFKNKERQEQENARFNHVKSELERLVNKYAKDLDTIYGGDALNFLINPPTTSEEFSNTVFAQPIDIALHALYDYDKSSYKKFVKGFTKYVDYLINTAARKKIKIKDKNGKIKKVTLKNSIKKPILNILNIYRENVGGKQEAANRLINEMTNILSRASYYKAVTH